MGKRFVYRLIGEICRNSVNVTGSVGVQDAVQTTGAGALIGIVTVQAFNFRSF
ncbi:MAG: hypothetical protein IJX55_07075 [Clostridia bacterium]|nr:hypothetical protein [Clostridia bacterium]